MADARRLHELLLSLGRIVLGYSGGVDSTLLAVTATRALGPSRFLAVIGRSASYPESQWRAAHQLASQFGIPLRELETRELDDPRYLSNPVNRCYFCKAELWTRLRAVAQQEGFDAVIDGTNADDLDEHRPGLAAGMEHEVRSPLAELGWTKSDVRNASRELGLPSWDAPASPCLSSRVRYGLTITPARLSQVERAEALVRALGVTGDLRVRHLGDIARIEVGPEEFSLVDERWDEIDLGFREIGFSGVERDPRGYRRGGLLALAPVRP